MPFYQLPSGASPVLAGSSPPTGGIGLNGDLFIDTANRFLYGPKAGGVWPSGINLSLGPTGPASTVTGPTGPRVTGPTGPSSTVTGPTGPGITGPTGGIAFSVGPTAPTAPALTVAGAVWLDETTGRYFVRYQTQFIEIGVQGERGPTGSTGAVSTVPGPTGPSGAASTVTGPAGVLEFAATGPTAPNLTAGGSVWLDTQTGKYFIKYQAQFIEIGVQGERGPTGAASTLTGPTGGPGPAGSTGPASTVPGPTGGPGPTGPASTVTGPTGSPGGFDDAQAINAQVTGYTLVLADAGKLLTFNASGSLNVIVPAAASVAFPTGTHVDVARLGAGAVTVTGASGVTINATPGAKLRAQYSAGTLILYEGDKWLVVGDLSQ
jgi:hypothetical protein